MGRDRRVRRARASWAGVAIAGLAIWSCAAGPFVETDAGFVHRRHGYRVSAPPQRDLPWRRVSVDGSDLAYERAGPVRMTLSSRCRVPLTRADVLARHLLIGVPHHTLRDAGAVSFDGLSGWQQVFDAVQDGALVRVKTVTLVSEGCVIDWVLSAREGRGFEAAEGDFEAWWHSLRVDTPEAEHAG
jgi:hypothetical protein